MMSVHKKTLGRVSGRWEHIFWVLAIITLAMVVRIALIAQGWPLLDSDEGTMGLMAMHVAYRGEFPVFFYGQAYMGATEAYLGAFFFHLFGVSAFTLRLGLIIIFVVFLIAMYALTALLYGRMLALITLLILALGSNAVLTRELAAVGGDPETLISGALLMALATWLALTSNPQLPQRRQWRRILLYGLWGLVAGFSLFSHVLGAPFIALSAIMLLLFCWRELLGWATACILAGAFISLSPLIYYNLTETTGKSTWFYVRHAMSAGNAPVHLWQQIKDALLISLPTATGAHPLCAVSSVHAVRLNSLNGIHCTLVHTGWSLGWLFLWTMAALGACGALWQLLRRHPHSWSLEDRQQAVRQWGRLSLLIIGGGTLFLYVLSPNSALYPVATSRYLIGLLIVTPALLYPLWQGLLVLKPLLVFISSRFFLSSRVEHDSMVIGRVILSGVVLIFAFGTFRCGVLPRATVYSWLSLCPLRTVARQAGCYPGIYCGLAGLHRDWQSFIPQYLIWLIPLLAYSGAYNLFWLIVWVLNSLLTTYISPYIYTNPIRVPVLYKPGFIECVTARNALLAYLTLAYLFNWWQVRSTREPRRKEVRSSTLSGYRVTAWCKFY